MQPTLAGITTHSAGTRYSCYTHALFTAFMIAVFNSAEVQLYIYLFVFTLGN